MYVSIGPGAVVRRGDLVGVFDLDNTTWSHRTRKSLAVCEREGRVIAVGDDLPRALVLCSERSRSGRRRKREHERTNLSVLRRAGTLQGEWFFSCPPLWGKRKNGRRKKFFSKTYRTRSLEEVVF